MDVKIEISQASLDSFLRAANGVIRTLRGIREIDLEAVGDYAIAKLKERTPGKKAPDTWRKEIVERAEETALRIFSEMTNDPATELILRVLEYGSKPHRILPRRPGGVLHFFVEDPLGSRSGASSIDEVFTKHVDHPGTKPYRMVRDTDRDIAELLDRLVRQSRNDLQQIWEKG